jgi:hypothetical protein
MAKKIATAPVRLHPPFAVALEERGNAGGGEKQRRDREERERLSETAVERRGDTGRCGQDRRRSPGAGGHGEGGTIAPFRPLRAWNPRVSQVAVVVRP